MTDQNKSLVPVVVQNLNDACRRFQRPIYRPTDSKKEMTPEEEEAAVRLVADKSEQAMVPIRQNPRGALILLNSVDQTAVSVYQQSSVLEFVLGEIADVGQAREMIANCLTKEKLAELYGMNGTRHSILDQLATPEQIRDAILQEVSSLGVESGEDEVFIALVIRAWALKLCDRDDWPEILKLKIDETEEASDDQENDSSGRTFYDYLLEACWLEFDPTGDAVIQEAESESDDDLPEQTRAEKRDWKTFVANDLVRFNMDVPEALERLEEMFVSDDPPCISADQFARVKDHLAVVRAERDAAFSTEARAAEDAAKLEI
jgi:hypothetical protein